MSYFVGRLKKDFPMLRKGSKFFFGEQSGDVFGYENENKVMDHPLRQGLAGYLWLLSCGESNKYIEKVEYSDEQDSEYD